MSFLVKGRDLLRMRPEHVEEWFLSQGVDRFDKVQIELDDGIHDSSVQRIVFSTFCWNFQRLYDQSPLAKRHLLTGRVTCTANVDLLSESYWDTFDAYNNELDLEYLDLIAYKSANAMGNYCKDELQEFVETLSLDDYVEVVESPGIKQALEGVEPNRRSIVECHDKISKLLLTAPDLAKATLAEFCRSKFISMGQVLQCIAPKGYPTEIDSRYFRYPILNSFLTGLNTLYESAAESRSATKALKYSQDYVEKGEYFQRKMQVGVFPIARLFKGDCGTRNHLEIEMREDLLHSFAGSYMLQENGTYKPIWKTDKHLVGKYIKLRSPIHCERFHEHGVCHMCFGYLGYSIVSGSNLGHISSSELCKDASQSLLGVKHSDATIDIADISLGDQEQQYLVATTDGEGDLRLVHNQNLKNLRLAVEERYVRNLTDIKAVDDLSKLTISNTSSIYSMQLWFDDEDGFEQVARLTVANGARMAFFTMEALDYIRRVGWSVSDNGMYVIDMGKWEYDNSLLSLPIQHANMLTYINDVEVFSRSSGKGDGEQAKDRLVNYDSLADGLMAFNKLVSSKLSVNIAHQAIVISAMTARATNDARLPMSPSKGVIMPYEDLIRMRSLAGTLAYEHLERIYGVPSTYINQKRCYHPMDALMAHLPEGVTVL